MTSGESDLCSRSSDSVSSMLCRRSIRMPNRVFHFMSDLLVDGDVRPETYQLREQRSNKYKYLTCSTRMLNFLFVTI